MSSSILEGPSSTSMPGTVNSLLSDRNTSRTHQNESFVNSDIDIKRTYDTFTSHYANMEDWVQFVGLEVSPDIHSSPKPYSDTSRQPRSTALPKEVMILDSVTMTRVYKNLTEIYHLIEKQKESSTLPKAPMSMSKRKMPTNILHELFYNARREVFEDGMDSHFSEGLHCVILEYGVAAIDQLRDMILTDDASVNVAEEALRQVGHVSDAKTHDARLSLLEDSLKSPEVRIRDAASLGIESMQDPRAIPSLERAAKHEQSEWLREYLTDVISRLKMHDGVPEVR